jgi:hypothetical protein
MKISPSRLLAAIHVRSLNLKKTLVSVVCAAAAFGATGHATTQDTWKPKDPPMLTRWAKDIDPKTPLPEYPRPQMTRGEWKNLNGLWNYAVVGDAAQEPAKWDGHILVPYPIESALSGVKKQIAPTDALVYERGFTVPASWNGRRLLLHFGAVDYRCEVLVNGRSAGKHEGGYDPFSFDITDLLNGSGEQKLVVKVADPTWTGGQPRGKQTLSPAGIMYTPTTGIWQTVWIEPVAIGAVEDLHIVPDVKSGVVRVKVDLADQCDGEVTVTVDGGSTATGKAGAEITIPVKDARLWAPDDPHLYDLTITVERGGKIVDEVGSYFGMRSVEMSDLNGEKRLLLNGKPVFMFGPLDQGFWPDGIYTAPTDAALKYDLEITKKLGFNTTRKHIKVEPARWYYHADKLGLLVWQDMPSANSYDAPPRGKPAVGKQAYETQLKAMLDNLENHPSIVMWVVFNEGQGQHDTRKLVSLVKGLDSTRLVNQASGGHHDGVGDVFDQHPYPAPRRFDTPASQAFVLGEYGGIGLKVGNNPWHAEGWGYTNTHSGTELENLYAQYAGKLRQLRDEDALCAAIYTQITDVEIEINGLMTYDRQLKVDPEWIAKANRFEWAGPVFTSIVPTSQETAQNYEFTTDKPADDWMKPGINTSSWKRGAGGFGTRGTAGVVKVGTEWRGSDIWVRRSFTVPMLDDKQVSQLALNLHHDEDVEVYLNGTLILEKKGFVSGYTLVPLTNEAKRAIKLGEENLIAIHCRQTGGGQFIDFGLGTLDPTRPKNG